MKPLNEDLYLAQPLLDRLIDNDPDWPVDRQQPVSEQLLALREALRRDLEFILNTRRRFLPLPARAIESPRSLAAFGMPDISNEDAESSGFRKSLPEVLKTIITSFEPRLRHVQIEMAPPRSETDCLLRFQIRADLVIQEGLEPVVFHTSLEPVQRLVRVETPRA